MLTGEVVEFGPDNEPLLVEVRPVAWLSDELTEEARHHYRTRMDAGKATH